MATVLGELYPGEAGTVRRIALADARLRRRLADMGITPMTEIQITRIAPLGDPVEVTLRGYALSLRRSDAMAIELMSDRERTAAEQAAWARAPMEDEQAAEKAGTADAFRNAALLTDWALADQQGRCGNCASCGACGVSRGMPAEPWSGRREPASGDADVRRVRENKRTGRQKTACAAPLRLALAGNPNSGKTTLFNVVTGARESVGNWPGVTVEQKERRFSAGGRELLLTDLPGIYSLSPYSDEERVSRDYLLGERPDAILNIVDATNLERSLYLTVQLMETGVPVVIALNMMDEVRRRGIGIDCRTLAYRLGVPVLPVCARTGEGVDALLLRCVRLLTVETAGSDAACPLPEGLYDPATRSALQKIGEAAGSMAGRAGLPAHWTQVRLLEGDAPVREMLHLSAAQQAAVRWTAGRYMEGSVHPDAESRLADQRYRCITRICAAAVQKSVQAGRTLTERIDRVLLGRWTGLPTFFLVMGAVFLLTFDTLGAFLSGGMERLLGDALLPWVQGALQSGGAAPWLVSLLCDGAIAGVGSVLTFLPQIAVLFTCLSLLEDSGYLARAAFLMDRALRRFGLSGRSFVPLLMGFGCTVPAAMSTRTMESGAARRMTILLLPFVSCSAKLPVYGLIAAAFFPTRRGIVVLSLYALGLLCGMAAGLLLRRTPLLAGDETFVLELPPYRLPPLKNTLLHVGGRITHFLERAGTVIFLMSLLLWALTHFDASLALTFDVRESLLARIGSAIAPVFAPLGFGSWQAAVALLTGLVAKEAVVSSLTLFMGAPGSALPAALGTIFTPRAAYAFLVFVLLYVPCAAAVAAMRRELQSTRLTAGMALFQLAAAYLFAFLAYTVGGLLH